MGANTDIQWTDATWNPTRGCTRVSPGCQHCYAERIASRFSGPGKPYAGLTETVNGHPRWTGTIQLVHDALELPKRWREPRRIFVDSMSDLFHEQVPTYFIFQVLAVCEETPRHTFQILTKRPERMRSVVTAWLLHGKKAPPANIWLGVSVEDQQRAQERTPLLLRTPAAVHFLSCEPLLGPLNLRPWLDQYRGADSHTRPLIDAGMFNREQVTLFKRPRIDWVIAGGESGGPPDRAIVARCGNCGRGAPASACHLCQGQIWLPKPPALSWARSIREECLSAGVSFFWKQWGGPSPKSGERLLDGRTWDQFPAPAGRAVPA